MSTKHGHAPGLDIPPDTLAQAAAYDYEVAQADAEQDLSAEERASRATHDRAGEAVGGLRSTGATLGDTAAAAKDSAAHAASDLGASAKDTARGAGHRLSSAAEDAAAKASAAAEAANEKVLEAQVDASERGWSWEGVKGWAADAWGDWQQRPQQWMQDARQAAEGWQEQLSWRTYEEWQEHHWRAFEERQRRRIAALTEEEKEKWKAWEERQKQRLAEGQQVVRQEIEAFERWQQRYWAATHPEQAAPKEGQKQATCPQCRLSFLMLPLLPNPREIIERFGRRTKMGIVGEMRETGAKLAEGLQAAGEKLGVTGSKAE